MMDYKEQFYVVFLSRSNNVQTVSDFSPSYTDTTATAAMRSVALATFKDVPLVREGAKASRAVRTVSAIAKAKDPLELLTAAFRQVPGASQCIRAISYVHNPAKLALDIGKKILQTGLNSGL